MTSSAATRWADNVNRYFEDIRHKREVGNRIVINRVNLISVGSGVVTLMFLPVLIGGAYYQSSLAFGVAVALMVFDFVAMFMTVRNLKKLSIITHEPAPVFAGETAHLPVRLIATSRREHYAVRLEYGIGKKNPPVKVADVSSGRAKDLEVVIRADKRGEYPVDSIRVASSYPFGISEARIEWITGLKLLVYPTPEQDGPRLLEALATSGQKNHEQMGWEDVDGVRPYRDGDRLSQMSWRHTAQTMHHGRPEVIVKNLAAGATATVMFRDDMLRGVDLERSLSRMARWALEAEAGEMAYGVDALGIAIAPGSGDSHKRLVLASLARHVGGNDGGSA